MTQKMSDDDLSLFFAAAREDDLPPALRARIIADAEASLPRPKVAPGLAHRLRSWASGWMQGWALPSVAGGVGATLAGLYLGLVMPLSLYDAPVWMDGALGVFDAVTAPMVGVADPLELGF